MSSEDALESMFGPWPLASVPSRCQADPPAVPSFRSPQSRRSSTSAVDASVPSDAGNATVAVSEPHAATRKAVDSGTEQATDHEAEGGRDDEPSDEIEARPGQDQADPDADEDQRPEVPEPADLIVGDVARADGERDGAGQDEEDAPAEEATSDMHGLNGTRRLGGFNGRMS